MLTLILVEFLNGTIDWLSIDGFTYFSLKGQIACVLGVVRTDGRKSSPFGTVH